MSNAWDKFARQLAQDFFRRTGELIIDTFDEEIPLKPALEELQNGTRRYPKSRTSAKQTEKIVRDRLASTIPGSQTEVSTPSGRIDILTPTEVIEVKSVRQYKHAIGQVISYSCYHPERDRRIHLFGKVSAKHRQSIVRECRAEKIEVTFEK